MSEKLKELAKEERDRLLNYKVAKNLVSAITSIFISTALIGFGIEIFYGKEVVMADGHESLWFRFSSFGYFYLLLIIPVSMLVFFIFKKIVKE